MPIVKHPGQRVGVFLDAQNLYHSAKNLYGAKVNFAAIMKEAIGGRSLIRALAYVIRTETGEESAFFDAIGKLGIEIKVKDLQVFGDGAKKADWDVGIAVDCIKLAPKLDAIVLVSGDGDYVPLVQYLKENMGVQVEVISFGRSTSAKLKEAVDSFTDMCDNPRVFTMGGERNEKRNKRPAVKRIQPSKDEPPLDDFIGAMSDQA